ncbi:zinc-binding dehydrogenase [Haematomicrobium sanguinis]|uniref:zinc-binding dehydrogenase n=1 Tax=Haematomicrobium sanguinis TaxID=479106 RepID=UPI0004790A00|nr:quinone oxidoreductase [Haematomicrobium sanguinis]
MLAAYVESFSQDDPIQGLRVGELDVSPTEGFVPVTVKAAALNHHDVFSLRGVGLSEEQLPMVLGTDGAGVDEDGNEVIIHGVIASPDWMGDETLDPKRSLLSERYPGTMAETVWVPRRNLVPKPDFLSFAEAACLPVSWLTAYKMLFKVSPAAPGSTMLVQGAGGGVATALIAMGRAAGYRVFATTRSERKAERARELGALEVFGSGERLPERVDVVFDSVGQATWEHSIKSLKPGGTIVTCGSTSGQVAQTDLIRVFFTQLRILGSTMGTRADLEGLLGFLDVTGVRPLIEAEIPLADARDGFESMINGELFGKVVFTLP